MLISCWMQVMTLLDNAHIHAQEIFREFPVSGIVWMDSSFRLLKDDFSIVFNQAVTNGGFFLFDRTHHSVYAFTAPAMYQYLLTDTEKLKLLEMYSANSMVIYPTEKMYHRFLYWWYLCALDLNCQRPHGIGRPCYPTGDVDRWKSYISGCHRFDQSALNILIGNLHDFDVSRYTNDKATEVVVVLRDNNKSGYQVQTCKTKHVLWEWYEYLWSGESAIHHVYLYINHKQMSRDSVVTMLSFRSIFDPLSSDYLKWTGYKSSSWFEWYCIGQGNSNAMPHDFMHNYKCIIMIGFYPMEG